MTEGGTRTMEGLNDGNRAKGPKIKGETAKHVLQTQSMWPLRSEEERGAPGAELRSCRAASLSWVRCLAVIECTENTHVNRGSLTSTSGRDSVPGTRFRLSCEIVEKLDFQDFGQQTMRDSDA